MTEAHAVREALARRCVLTRAYMADPVLEEDEMVRLHQRDRDILIYVEPDKEGRVLGALSFLTLQGSSTDLHLNGWCRPDGLFLVSELVDALWAAFWLHEQENKGIGRALWMSGADLPPEVPAPAQVLLEFRKLPELDVLDLFGMGPPPCEGRAPKPTASRRPGPSRTRRE